MKRNISVFILLLLLVSSFKYKSKSNEKVLPPHPITDRFVSNVNMPSVAFEDAVLELQKGNREFAQGNASFYKALWSQRDDVTNFCGLDGQESKGWQAVAKSLDAFHRKIQGKKHYSIEKIASNAGPDQGYVLQKEHYVLADGQNLDFHVTIVLRREGEEWKIVHRHSDKLAMSAVSVIAAK